LKSEVVANLSLHSKQLELGQDMLKYSNPDRIMTLSGLPENWKWDPVQTSNHCQLNLPKFLHFYQKPRKYFSSKSEIA